MVIFSGPTWTNVHRLIMPWSTWRNICKTKLCCTWVSLNLRTQFHYIAPYCILCMNNCNQIMHMDFFGYVRTSNFKFSIQLYECNLWVNCNNFSLVYNNIQGLEVFHVKSFQFLVNSFWPSTLYCHGVYSNEPRTFTLPLTSRAIEPTIINIIYDQPLVCRNQLHYEGTWR